MPTYRELLQTVKAEIAEVDAPEALALDGALFVDVRRYDEWEQGHLPGAVHVPRGSLESRIEGVVPDRATPIVLYCASGERSAFGAKSLAELGYENVVSLAGGFNEWKRNGFEIVMPKSLSPERRARYSRHLLIPEIGDEGQLKLLDSRILLLGAGGLGSPAALYLAAAGVGHIGIVDADIVDESNLQRQIAHSLDTLGTPKVDSAKRAIQALNPDVEVRTYRERLTSENIDRILDDGWEIVVDGADNFPTRYLLNDASVWRGDPRSCTARSTASRARSRSSSPARAPATAACTPRRRRPSSRRRAPRAACSEFSRESSARSRPTRRLKLALGIGDPLIGRLLLIDALAADFTEVHITRDPNCPVCGEHPTITEYVDYVDSAHGEHRSRPARAA